MTGTLHVVATPIGNLEDITLRALRVLREVALIAAEDTRRTAKLLSHHGISTPTISFHEHNARARLPALIRRLQAGSSVALVTDAGTPGVSDPGVELVQACISEGIPVDPVPGASALLTAIVGSGFAATPLSFLGFPPSKAKDRSQFWSAVSRLPHTVVFFEAPHRIQSTLQEAARVLGVRPLALGRELTKLHQEFLRGTAVDLANRLNNPKGEFTIVVGPRPEEPPNAPEIPQNDALAHEFRQITEAGALTRRQAITELARRYSISARDVYARLESVKTGLS
jgi:16S rRNA (cytidine1402-2'-O)-methyltransferase